jgi:hypothetical protein
MGVIDLLHSHHPSISTLQYMQVADGCELVSNRSLYGNNYYSGFISFFKSLFGKLKQD